MYEYIRNIIRDTINKLKQRGVIIGEDVKIYNSYNDMWGYLILIRSHVTITNALILAHDGSMKRGIGKASVKKVSIGDYVFVGYHSIILPGVSIGSHVIIGAGTVVAKDIPDNSVVIGNSMRMIGTWDDYMNKEAKKTCNYKIKESKIGYVDELRAKVSILDGEIAYVK